MENIRVYKLDRKEVTSEIFAQIVAVENSSDNGYTEDQLEELWIEDKKNDNRSYERKRSEQLSAKKGRDEGKQKIRTFSQIRQE